MSFKRVDEEERRKKERAVLYDRGRQGLVVRVGEEQGRPLKWPMGCQGAVKVGYREGGREVGWKRRGARSGEDIALSEG